MNSRTLLVIALAITVGLGTLVYADRTLAQAVAQMPMGQMMGQMQRQMNQMTANLRAMRAQLDKINPALLTPSERAMFEYLTLLQTHMETMQVWMGTAQGAMRQMPGMMRRP